MAKRTSGEKIGWQTPGKKFEEKHRAGVTKVIVDGTWTNPPKQW